ncbi:hypothetical protein F5Y12DRAFT_65640 [Xylaria sp. FL1777]|nr:hypothetical protein F5Y12DRAFT_65640 [Xylaria sp. FL1777]
MQDALRPNDEVFRTYYEKGYKTWFELWEKASANYDLPATCLQFENIYPQHPHLPNGLHVDKSGLVIARTTWVPAQGSCDLPSFEQLFLLQATVPRPVTIDFAEDPGSLFPKWPEKHNHIAILVLAWAYVLSARWAEIIPRASALEYSESLAPCKARPTREKNDSNATSAVVDIGNANDKAARWWAAVLAPGQGWKGRIPHERYSLQPPWSLELEAPIRFVLSGADVSEEFISSSPATFTDAAGYIEEYVALHDASRQNRIAFAAALLLPLANLERRKAVLPLPQSSDRKATDWYPSQSPIWGHDLRQLDRLLTLSCNSNGMRAILGSIFYEPNTPSHVCGAWLQGTAALLQSNFAQDPHILACMFSLRSPHLTCLWLGAIVCGVHPAFIRSRFGLLGLLGFNRIDLHEAAWTGTLLSFIQEPVTRLSDETTSISRADECRLMYLSQGLYKDTPPIFPYPPLGDIPLHDADVDVQAHAHCLGSHSLRFSKITWPCEDGRKEVQNAPQLLLASREPNIDNELDGTPIRINYDMLDRDKDLSETVTRNIFEWMRDMDGFPISERDIYRHEWIYDSDDSEDDETLHPEGEGLSTAGWNVSSRTGLWLSRAVTQRCNSL